MKLIIAGGRKFNDYNLLKERCDYFLQNHQEIELVTGKAEGADFLGEWYAKNNNYIITEFPASWQDIEGKPLDEILTRRDGNKYWSKAGLYRNVQMAEYADVLIAFWDGKSKGTRHMIDTAIKHKLKYKIVKY